MPGFIRERNTRSENYCIKQKKKKRGETQLFASHPSITLVLDCVLFGALCLYGSEVYNHRVIPRKRAASVFCPSVGQKLGPRYRTSVCPGFSGVALRGHGLTSRDAGHIAQSFAIEVPCLLARFVPYICHSYTGSLPRRRMLRGRREQPLPRPR